MAEVIQKLVIHRQKAIEMRLLCRPKVECIGQVGSALAAGRGNDVVHPRVFDELAVMVEGVRGHLNQ